MAEQRYIYEENDQSIWELLAWLEWELWWEQWEAENPEIIQPTEYVPVVCDEPDWGLDCVDVFSL